MADSFKSLSVVLINRQALELTFDSILNPRPFNVFVGERAKPYFVHEGAIAPLSPSLSSLLRGPMLEGQYSQITWEDVNTDVFEAFTEFACTGDYFVSTMVLAKEHDEPVDEPSQVSYAEPLADNWGFQSFAKKKRYPTETPASSRFESRFSYLVETRSRFSTGCDLMLEWSTSDNVYNSVLLHASLYVLADKWGVDELISLSLFKLHKSLILLENHRKPVPDIVSLIQYAYSDENTADREPSDLLRELFCHFVADHAREMSKDTLLLLLLEEGDPFARDVWNTKIASS